MTTLTWKVQLSELNYDGEEVNAVSRVLKSEWLTIGSETDQFESEFSKFIQHENQGVFVSSATAALHLILMYLKLKNDDEVIIPAMTFVSDANVVSQLNAKIVFADSVSLQNFNASVTDIIQKITEKTKAIVIVHFAGYPMDLSELVKICDEKGITLIEDCAHAPGASIASQMCGSLGHFSFFSFFSNKNLAVGEGGMVFGKDKCAIEEIRQMRSHGMSAPTLHRHLGRASSYDIITVGLNYRPDEIRAALGREQLKKLTNGNMKRRQLVGSYRKLLSDTGILVPFQEIESINMVSAYHIMPIILPKSICRETLITGMRKQGIQTSIHYPSFKSFTAYCNLANLSNTPVADEICLRELTLPLHPRMEISDTEYVVQNLKLVMP